MKDLTNLKTFIIDSKNPIEIDDAISLEIDKNIKNIWIHVSYPSKIFEFNSELDIKAKNRSASLYLTDRCISMLPKNIIEQSNLIKKLKNLI